MLNGTFALLGRSLRIDARTWSSHLARVGLLGAIYCSLCFALSSQGLFGAPGLRLLGGIAYLDAAFLTLLGIGFFSTAITEEKEEDTLGLMLMAGISPLGILVGKSGGRLWQALLLVAVQYPFMLLAVTMGGVTPGQTLAVTVALLAFMICLAGFGLLCSMLASRSRTAGVRMVIGLAVYVIVPGLARSVGWALATRRPIGGAGISNPASLSETILDGIGDFCVFIRLNEILASGFSESPFSVQAVSNTIAGLVFAGLSWLFFGVAVRNLSSEANSRGFVLRKRAFFPFSAGRPWSNPFVWKDFHFVSGGVALTLVRIAFYVGIGIVMFSIPMIARLFPLPFQFNDSLTNYFMLTSLAVSIDAGIVLARSMHDEVRSQTLSSVMMLPRSPVAIVYSKFAGTLMGWLPGPIIELTVAFCTEGGRSNLLSIARNEHGGFAASMLFVLVPHFSAVAALYVSRGAVPIGIGATVGVYFAIVAGVQSTGGGNPGDAFFHVVAFLMVCICVGCQIAVLLRVQALAAK